jgi:hypothetical protein
VSEIELNEDQAEILDAFEDAGVGRREGADVEIVVGSEGEEERRTTVEDREIDSLRHPELRPYLESGIPLKESAKEKPREPREDDEPLGMAVRVAKSEISGRKQAETQRDDLALTREVLSVSEAWTAAWQAGEVEEDQAANAHLGALQAARQITDDDLRTETLERLEQFVDEDTYEDFVAGWQRDYSMAELQEQEEQAQAESERLEQEGRVLNAVYQTEEALLKRLPEDLRYIAGSLIQANAEAISKMEPRDVHVALRYATEMARQLSQNVFEGEQGAAIVRAMGGQNKLGLSGREIKDKTAFDLGLAITGFSEEEREAAWARAVAGVKSDWDAAKRQHAQGKNTGLTGKERANARRKLVTEAQLRSGKLKGVEGR